MKDLKNVYKNCDLDCIHFLNGELHMCCRSSHAMKLQLIPRDESDYIDYSILYEKKFIRRKLFDLLKGKTIISVCNYCNPRGVGEKIISAQQDNAYL